MSSRNWRMSLSSIPASISSVLPGSLGRQKKRHDTFTLTEAAHHVMTYEDRVIVFVLSSSFFRLLIRVYSDDGKSWNE